MDFTVLGLLGPAGSGKDLTADWFVEKGFVKCAFADPMKRFCQKTFGLTTEQLWGPTSERNKEFEIDDSWWYEAIGHMGEAAYEIVTYVLNEGNRVSGYLRLHDWLTQLRTTYRDKISTRVILQTLGTEWGRAVDPLMWVRYGYKMVDGISQGSFYSQVGGIVETEMFYKSSGVIIPDHRFINEIEASQGEGTYVMRVRRLALEKKDEKVGVSGHQSEAEQKAIPDSVFDYVLEFEEGIDKVHQTLGRVYAEELWRMKRAGNRS